MIKSVRRNEILKEKIKRKVFLIITLMEKEVMHLFKQYINNAQGTINLFIVIYKNIYKKVRNLLLRGLYCNRIILFDHDMMYIFNKNKGGRI